MYTTLNSRHQSHAADTSLMQHHIKGIGMVYSKMKGSGVLCIYALCRALRYHKCKVGCLGTH